MHHYPFHLGDYLAHTAHLDPIEDIVYRRMLDLYYLREGPLPHDVVEIARLIRMRDSSGTVQSIVTEFFDDAEEGYRHRRCDDEIARYRAMVDGGRNGAAKRWGKGGDPLPMAKVKGGHGEGIAPPNGNQNQEPEPEPEPTTPKPPRADLFGEFWASFPRKAGKEAAQRAFEKRRPDRPMLDRMLAAIAQQRASPQWTKDWGEFIPHPSTWLNQGRWQDEVVPSRPLSWGEQEAQRRYPNGLPAGYVPMAGPAGG